ncbi:MAG: enoyl-CoA hydratase/isomerase family protein [Betaproteobacteria bacterium]|nr:enoyl-CoA hydratase/isomerase family protein [Betaproteobacteria bacterium]
MTAHWHLETDADGLAWLTFDRAATSTNTFSTEALNQLAEHCRQLHEKPPKGLVIQSAKANGFAAGADIDEFTGFKNVDEAIAFTRLGNEVFDQLEALPFPTVALIHGFCMGGGLELSLACRYRIADDGPKTRMALPEVMIGIVPGWGGAKRLPRLVGAAPALDLILTGRSVDGKKAKRLGLIDALTPRRHFAQAARQLLAKPPAPHQPALKDAIGNWPLVRGLIAAMSRKQVAKKVRQEHYPAPYAIIDLWEKFGGEPRAVPPDHPISIGGLFKHPTTANLIRIFKLQDRLKALGNGDGINLPDNPRLHVIGAGVMGGDIAAWCALKGFTVTLQDLDHSRIAPAIQRAATLYQKRLKQPHLVQAALDRLIPDIRGDGVGEADLIIEAIVENVEIKRKLYAQLEPRLKPSAILATNTSSIPLQQLSEGLAQPERLVGIHFFNPVAQMMLVEIVEGPQTSATVMKQAAAYVKKIDKLPLPVKSAPGFLVNRILAPYMNEAQLMLEEGIPAEVIDAAAQEFGMPMGPIELVDTVGLDVALAVGKELDKPGNPQPQKIQQLVADKKLGKKTGEGFYRWVATSRGSKPLKTNGSGTVDLAPLWMRMTLPAVNEAVACVREGIVADADLCDAGVIFGTGFAPHRGGPIRYLQTMGKEKLLAEMKTLEARHGSRFTPDAGWAPL